MLMAWEAPLLLLFLFISFLFSFAETAVTSLGRLELQKLLRKGGRTARLTQNWMREPSRVLIVVLIGNNISNTLASAVFTLYIEHNYPHYLPPSLAIFSIVMIILGEIVPKLMARLVSVQTAPYAMAFLRVVGRVLYPIVYVAERISSGIVVMTGLTRRSHRKSMSEEDITHTIEIATKEGGIDHATGTALTNLIDFAGTCARDIMTARSKIASVSVTWTREEVLRVVVEQGHSRYPVISGSNLDDVVGLLLAKDFLQPRALEGSWTRLVRRPFFVTELTTAGSVMREMRRKGVHMAVVRNETGVVTGLVTLEDLLEEIVGEIRDEHDDPSEAGHEMELGGPRLVNGEMPVIDFNERFGVRLPLNATYSTINGYLLSRTGGQLPPVGTLIFTEEATFRIHSIDKQGVVTVELL